MDWFISNQRRQAPSVDAHDAAAAKPSIDFLNSDISGDVFDQTPLTDTDSDDSEGTARGISTSDLVSRNGRPTNIGRALAQLGRHWSRGERQGLTTAALLVKECKVCDRGHMRCTFAKTGCSGGAVHQQPAWHTGPDALAPCRSIDCVHPCLLAFSLCCELPEAKCGQAYSMH